MIITFELIINYQNISRRIVDWVEKYDQEIVSLFLAAAGIRMLIQLGF